MLMGQYCPVIHTRCADGAGHLSGIVPEGPEKALLAAFVATSLLFAGRKYTQAIKDDIGDKSVFMCVQQNAPLALHTL